MLSHAESVIAGQVKLIRTAVHLRAFFLTAVARDVQIWAF